MSELEPTLTNSNLTATDRLRAMLDERGVEWEDCGNGATYVDHNGEAWRFDYDEPFDQLAIVCLSGYTPAQAIAATLGAAYEPPVAAHWDGDVLTLTIPRDPSCIRVRRSVEQPCKVYADESKVIAATLGSCNCTNNCTNSERTETCEAVLDSERDNQPYLKPRFVCSECGCQLTESRLGKVWQNYCPNCGRRIEQ